MKVSQEKRPQSQMGLEIEITPEMSKQAYDRVIKEYASTVKIPGFRKGKVPRQVLVQRLGSENLKAAALEKVIEEASEQAIAQEKIEALDKCQLVSEFSELVKDFQPGQPLTFNVAVDVPPETQIKQYTDLTIKVEEVKYDPATVDRILEEEREKEATLIPVEERPAQMGDVTVIDFAGRLASVSSSEGETEGETEIPGAKASEFELELKEGGFIPGFVEGIVGMQLGETKEVPLQFPEDYAQENLKGKAAIFTITLKDIKEKELPELDDEFAAEISDHETIAQLREALENKYKAQAEDQTAANKDQEILEVLVKQAEVEIPQSMIEREVDKILTQSVYELAKQGFDVKKLLTAERVSQMRDRTRPEAIALIKRQLVVSEVAKRESIEVESEAIEAKMKEILAEYSQKEEIDPNILREVVQQDQLTQKVLGWVGEHCTIELVPEGSRTPVESEAAPEALGTAEAMDQSDKEETGPEAPAEAMDQSDS